MTTYSKQTWHDAPGATDTPISAAALTHIEDGIDAATLRSYMTYSAATAANTSLTVNHGLNWRAVDVVVTRTWLQVGAVGNANPGDVVPMKVREIDENNIALEFGGYGCATNEYRIDVFQRPLAIDTTGPSPGTLSSPTQGLTTIDLSLGTGTDSETTPAGVWWYQVIGGVDTLVATTGSTGGVATVQIAGLSANTAYQFKAKRFNLNGTPGTISNTLSVSTLAPADVTVLGSAVQAYNASGNAVSTAGFAYPAGSLTMSVAFIKQSHNEWVFSYNQTITVQGTQSGTWTELIPTGGWNSGNVPDVFPAQPSGGVRIFYKLSPDSTNWTNDVVTATFGTQGPTTPVGTCITILHLGYVDQTTPFGSRDATPLKIVTDTTNNPASVGILSNAGDYTISCIGKVATAPTAPTKTQVGSTQGGDVAGFTDYFACSRAATASNGTVTHGWTLDGNVAHAQVIANVRKAGT